jgi:hypothetical protein
LTFNLKIMKSTNNPHHRYQLSLTKLSGFLLAVLVLLLGTSCQKYLDAKPDKSLEIPANLQDYQALLDNRNFNIYYPYAADIGSDDYFVSYADWSSFSLQARNDYVWDGAASNDQDWNYAYKNILSCNVVYNQIDQVPVNSGSAVTRNNIKGAASFFRGYIFYQLANVFTLPYNKESSGQTPGLPLRLKANLTESISRSTLEETYQRIITDLKNAAALLPVRPAVRTRPSKPAAYAALARTYLTLQDYRQANLYADSCLQLYHQLIDYNTLDTATRHPFSLLNDEVIFHAVSTGLYDVVDPYYAKVDSNLYATYANNDLRKVLFYYYADHGHYIWKGDYYGQSYGPLFAGIATDEVLLIRAESAARLGNVTQAVNDLNTLLKTRYQSGAFAPYTGTMSADAALLLILTERRKELAFRSGIRWSDLKRLNQDSRFAKTLTRQLNGKAYTLPPGDKRYAFLLPVSVVQMSGVPQNER